MTIKRAPQKLSTVEILFELDKKGISESQKLSLTDELKKRKLDRQSFEESVRAFKQIKRQRANRANKPLSLGFKILCVILPFIVNPKGKNNYMDTFKEHWDRGGYTRKTIEFYKYSLLGASVYIFLAIAFVIYSKTGLFKKPDTKATAFGRQFNAERIKKGVPLIEQEWFTKDKGYKSMYLWSDFKKRISLITKRKKYLNTPIERLTGTKTTLMTQSGFYLKSNIPSIFRTPWIPGHAVS